MKAQNEEHQLQKLFATKATTYVTKEFAANGESVLLHSGNEKHDSANQKEKYFEILWPDEWNFQIPSKFMKGAWQAIPERWDEMYSLISIWHTT